MNIKPTLKKSKIVLIFLIFLASASPVASQIKKRLFKKHLDQY